LATKRQGFDVVVVVVVWSAVAANTACGVSSSTSMAAAVSRSVLSLPPQAARRTAHCSAARCIARRRRPRGPKRVLFMSSLCPVRLGRTARRLFAALERMLPARTCLCASTKTRRSVIG
jgi:hypothetical protein